MGWLLARGVVVSPEDETTRNSATEMARRRWDDGRGAKRQFELHLKPADAVAPDRCVRIYFDYDDALRKTVVGWVGRHPKE